jgi:hypothetical protein
MSGRAGEDDLIGVIILPENPSLSQAEIVISVIGGALSGACAPPLKRA